VYVNDPADGSKSAAYERDTFLEAHRQVSTDCDAYVITGIANFDEKIKIVGDPGDIRNCKVEFKCPKRWDELKKQDIPDTRHCHVCDECVYLCTTDAQIAEAIRLDHCVAISPDSEWNGVWDSDFVGRLAPPDYDGEN